MCLIIHKPAGRRIAGDLLEAALSLNGDGFGLMGARADGRLLLVRRPRIALDELLALESDLREADYVLHLRQRTRGDTGVHNVQPFRVASQTWLMHNGTLHSLPSNVPGRSDSWHLVQHLLRPLAQRRSGVLLDNAFLRLLELAVGPENKLALFDFAAQRFVLINQEYGAELDGLWLSSTRWIDHRLLPLADTPQPQERSFLPEEVHFL